ncbi:hypothetical protein ACXR0O_27105 [Verrucomicrobiota bacterium sgz303538]
MEKERQRMSPYLEQALRLIEEEDPEGAGEGFLMLEEVVAVNCLSNFQSESHPEANAERLDEAALCKLQRAIQDWIERNPEHCHAGTAFWVLGKFNDETLIPFLRHWLARYVERIVPSLHPLRQILVDLDNLGGMTVPDGSSTAYEYGKNLDQAIRYLNEAAKA